MARVFHPVVFFFSTFVVPFMLSAAPLPAPLVPDASTPGSLCSTDHEDFAEYRYGERIPYCERNVSSGLKNDIYRQYGVPTRCKGEYTIDHFFPLSLGGDNSRENLWPEPKAVKAIRKNLETQLYRQLARGEITQAAALAEIRRAKLNPDANQIPEGDYCDLR